MRDRVLSFLQRFDLAAKIDPCSPCFPEHAGGTVLTEDDISIRVTGSNDYQVVQLTVTVSESLSEGYGNGGSFCFIKNDDVAENLVRFLMANIREERASK